MFNKIISFFQESKQELKRVEWPSRKQTVRLTIVVILISLIAAAFLGVLDLGFAQILKLFIK